MMVGKTRMLHRVATGAAGVLCLQAIPALAQDVGDRANGLSFGIEQSLEIGRNLELSVPARGTSTVSTTRLSLSYYDATPISQFAFDVAGALRLADTPDGSENGFADPALRLRYARAGANAGLVVSARAEQTDLRFDRDLSDFIGDDGSVDLPDDFDSTSEGKRNEYFLGAELSLERRAPLSYVLGASYQATDYTDITAGSDLDDETTLSLDATANLRLSAISAASVALGYDDIETDDLTETHRQVTSLTFGYTRELSARARFGARLGFSHTEREVLGPIRTSENEATAEVDASYDLPTGLIGGSIGVTRPDGGGTELIGRLNWRQDLPTGSITAVLSQQAETTADGETRPTTGLSINYTQDINALSGVDFGLTYVIASGTATRNRVEESEIAVTYRRALTEDWAMRTGLSYQTRNEDTVGSASSPFAFVSVGRKFDLR